MKKNKIIILGTLFLLAGWFYWFQWRPSQIRSSCDQIAWDSAIKYYDDREDYDWKYTQCLHSKGLK